MAEDTRPLPASLVEPLRADLVRDLDIFDTGELPIEPIEAPLPDRSI